MFQNEWFFWLKKKKKKKRKIRFFAYSYVSLFLPGKNFSETAITVPFPYLTTPPYFVEGEKNFGFFSCKRPFFFIGKKGRGLTVTAPPHFREKCSEGEAVGWVCSDIYIKISALRSFQCYERKQLQKRKKKILKEKNVPPPPPKWRSFGGRGQNLKYLLDALLSHLT